MTPKEMEKNTVIKGKWKVGKYVWNFNTRLLGPHWIRLTSPLSRSSSNSRFHHALIDKLRGRKKTLWSPSDMSENSTSVSPELSCHTNSTFDKWLIYGNNAVKRKTLLIIQVLSTLNSCMLHISNIYLFYKICENRPWPRRSWWCTGY